MSNIIRYQSSYIEPYPLQMQGESNYRANIEDVCGFVDDDEGVNADDFIAQLIFDDKNIYDPGNAVRVDINGKTVGYLSKPGAKAYRKHLAELGLSDVIGECYASIKGGFLTRDGQYADFGVRLDLNLDDFGVLPTKAQSDPETITPTPQPDLVRSAPSNTGSVPLAKSSLRKIQDWFFGRSEYRTLRIILFFFLALSLSFCACIACGTILRFIPGNS